MSSVAAATAAPGKRKRMCASDELAVITGGGSGIGQATTLRLLERGLTVVAMGPFQDQLDETRKLVEAKNLPGTLTTVCADIREERGCQAVADEVRRTGKTLRTLIHCAGVNTPCKMMMDLSREEWSRAMDINMNGPLFMTQALYPLFGNTDTAKNRILFLTTFVKMCTGLPNYGPYCVSKLGAHGVCLMLKQELSNGKTPIHTSMLIPGEVNTGMQEATAYSNSSSFPAHLVKHWRKLHENGLLLPPVVAGAFIEYVLCDTTPEDFTGREWFLYDKDHHPMWAGEFPDQSLEEPKGLAGDH